LCKAPSYIEQAPKNFFSHPYFSRTLRSLNSVDEANELQTNFERQKNNEPRHEQQRKRNRNRNGDRTTGRQDRAAEFLVLPGLMGIKTNLKGRKTMNRDMNNNENGIVIIEELEDKIAPSSYASFLD
jgi:hypothetical protein